MLGFSGRFRLMAIAFACVAGLLFLFWLTCVHHTEAARVGIMRNVFTGEMSTDTPGWNITAPWVKVVKIDLRPMRLCITSAGKGYNCKLVQFQESEWREFVATEGFYYWWWANRASFNLGYDEEYRGIKDLMRGYAYAATKYNFIVVVQQL